MININCICHFLFLCNYVLDIFDKKKSRLCSYYYTRIQLFKECSMICYFFRINFKNVERLFKVVSTRWYTPSIQ